MSSVPESLLRLLGTPDHEGDTWVKWKRGGGGSMDVVVWRRGSRFAKDMATGERYWAGDDSPRFAGVEVVLGVGEEGAKAIGRLPAAKEAASWRPLLAYHEPYAYLEGRGLSHGEIASWCVYDSERPYLAVFPVEEDGKVVAWQGRRIDDGTPKYDSGRSKDGWLQTAKTCWGLDRLRAGKPAYLCEGIFDAIYFPHGVAVLGSNLHQTQLVKVLDRRPSEIILCFDLKDDWKPDRDQVSRWRQLVMETTLSSPRMMLPGKGAKDFGELVARGERHRE